MKFKEWLHLQEIGTGTNAVANFSRIIGTGEGDLIRRGETCDRDKKGKCHLPLVMMRFNSPKIGNALEHKR
jgi:hypothetical protein